MASFSVTIPRPLDSFIGRAEELNSVRSLLAAHRLVTLTGAAGIGKTRLAIRIAEELVSDYSDGACFVALVGLTDPALVPRALASALGLREGDGAPGTGPGVPRHDRPLLQTLTDFLAPRNLLLVWDNCDYLIDACRALAQALLGACPQVQVLATSRRSLRVPGETLYSVPPFSVPGAELAGPGEQNRADAILAYEAPRLFKERAGEVLTDFTIRPEDAAAVAQICRQLDGIPLAVELAAGRIRELSVQQIAARLDERFHLLTGGASANTHQQTLATAIGWSYDLLSEPEKRLLARLSVFAGGWDLEAAERVCASDSVAERKVLDLLTGLIDKSWIIGESHAAGVRRYRFLESVREYSRERLKETAEEMDLRARHAEFYLQLAETAESELAGSAQAAWLDRLEHEHENLRAALAWCWDHESGAEAGLRLAGALAQFWEIRGHLSEGRRYLAEALGREGGHDEGSEGPRAPHHGNPTQARAKALNGAAMLAWMQGDYGAARGLFEESLVIARALGNQWGIAWSVHQLGHVAAEQGNYEAARAHYAESLTIFRELGDRSGIAASLADQGNVAQKQSDHEAARSMYEESLAISRELGNKLSVAISLNNLGKIARAQGDPQAARMLHAESLAIRRELGDRGGIAWSLEAFARLWAPEDPERAVRLWGAAESLRESIGLPLPPIEREEYDHHLAAVRAALSPELFAPLWAQGRAMTVEQAAECAHGEDDEDRPTPGAHDLPLLSTKLALPVPSPNLLSRPRLTRRLEAAASARLALLVAPAGSGKSTLVNEWCQQQPEGSVAWLSLDAEDRDPTRFLLYLYGALERVAPAAAAPIRALLQADPLPSPGEIVTSLLNRLEAIPQRVTLVLDDYHAIDTGVVHELVTFLVEHLPPTLFLILATRSDPPLPLPRLRLRGQLIEIRAGDLRFSHEEAAQFLNERMGLALPPERIDLLAERTEGWIAGLQMAALSLQGEADPGGFLDAFAGSNRYLVDYLFEEVLQRQTPEVQSFLGKTAFLDRLCGSLCEAVTGAPGGQAMLERLEAANLFLVPLDRERRWYRYHQLFADVLRAKVPQEAEQLRRLHDRAAEWYESEGLTAEAIEHLLAGGQLERAAPLIERQYESVWQPGTGRSLWRWLQALPPELIRTRPYLSFALASLHNYHFRVAEAEVVLSECRFEPQDDTPATRDLQGRLLMARGWTARLRGETTKAALLSDQALKILPAESRIFRSYARFNRAMLLQESGDLVAAEKEYAGAIQEAQQGAHAVFRVLSSYAHGQLQEIQGGLREASRIYEEALGFAQEQQILHTPAAALLDAGLGRIRYQRDELPSAAASLADGLERVDSAFAETNPIYAVPCLLGLLRLRGALGDSSGADAMFERLAEIARTLPVPCLDPLLALLRVRKHLSAPEEFTAAWLTAFEARTEGHALPPVPIPEARVPDIRALEIVTWALLRRAQGETASIVPRLERFLEAMVQQGRHGSALEVRALLAALHWQSGHREEAIAVLEPALAFAEREGYVRVFLDAGPALTSVLRQAAARGIAPEYVGRLLAPLGNVERGTGAPAGSTPSALIEPLSDRELEVLRLVAAGLRAAEIAAKLFLSEGTVRRHLHNLYGKLGVTSGTSAVAKGRALGLL
jgi:LuxR family maltose regulon positive regulatory protein